MKCAGGRRAERARYTVGFWFFTAKLVIDEFALFKGHRYAAVVLDADTRLVLWVGEGSGTASSAGGHFNPGATQHGDPAHAAHHGGDFGNIVADAGGVASFQMSVPIAQINLIDGSPVAVLNRAVIVHAAPDDLITQPTGNSGARVACGVIALKRE